MISSDGTQPSWLKPQRQPGRLDQGVFPTWKSARRALDLHMWGGRQALKTGIECHDHRLVFCPRTSTPLEAGNVRHSFQAITKAAGSGGNWTPRELRHSSMSIMSDHGVPIEKIADLVGHKSSTVTERVYRHQLEPVIAEGATTMNMIFQKEDQHVSRRLVLPAVVVTW